MNRPSRRDPHAYRLAGGRRPGIACRAMPTFPMIILGTLHARRHHAPQVPEPREAARVGVWEAEGGALAA